VPDGRVCATRWRRLRALIVALIDDLKSRLRPEEGRRLFAYRDSLGHLTIGDGFLLEGAHVALMQQLLGLSDLQTDSIVRGASPITPAQSDMLLEYTALRAVSDAQSAVGDDAWDRLADAAKVVLADMAFNMGAGGLGAFHKMLAAARQTPPDFVEFERQMNDSAWDRQVPARADDLEALIHSLIPNLSDDDRARVSALFVVSRLAAGAHAGDVAPSESSDA
jgi:GH24 family phage-related lysozyme (muramidase)